MNEKGRLTINDTRSNGESDDSRLLRSQRPRERVHGSFRARIRAPSRDALRRRSRRDENDPPGEFGVLRCLDEVERGEGVGDDGNEGEVIDLKKLPVLL